MELKMMMPYMMLVGIYLEVFTVGASGLHKIKIGQLISHTV